MNRIFATITLCLCLTVLGACKESNSGGKEGDYDATKKMVLDILQTDDGKKALVEIMSDEKLKKQLTIASDVVQDAINNSLVSEKSADMWAHFFEDPTFVENFAQSMSEEHTKLIKSLMHDADYQKQMLDILQNPEMSQHILNLLRSQPFRSHLEETIQQTLETPLFQSQITKTLLKAAEKKAEDEQQDEQQDTSSNEDKNKANEQNEGNDNTEMNN